MQWKQKMKMRKKLTQNFSHLVKENTLKKRLFLHKNKSRSGSHIHDNNFTSQRGGRKVSDALSSGLGIIKRKKRNSSYYINSLNPSQPNLANVDYSPPNRLTINLQKTEEKKKKINLESDSKSICESIKMMNMNKSRSDLSDRGYMIKSSDRLPRNPIIYNKSTEVRFPSHFFRKSTISEHTPIFEKRELSKPKKFNFRGTHGLEEIQELDSAIVRSPTIEKFIVEKESTGETKRSEMKKNQFTTFNKLKEKDDPEGSGSGG